MKTRRERLKSTLYPRLKRRKIFKICLGPTYEKLRKQFRDTRRVPFMLNKTRKPLFPQRLCLFSGARSLSLLLFHWSLFGVCRYFVVVVTPLFPLAVIEDLCDWFSLLYALKSANFCCFLLKHEFAVSGLK